MRIKKSDSDRRLQDDRRAKWRTQLFPFAMMAPFLVMVGVFALTPVLMTVALSFTDFDYSMTGEFVGLQNYLHIFDYPGMDQILQQTLLYVVVSVFFSVLGSIFVVIITTYYLDIVYKRKNLGLIFRVLWLIPDLTPTIVYMFMWRFIFGTEENGLINMILVSFEMSPVAWFTSFSMFLLLFTTVLRSSSGSIILFSSAISQIPENVINSAKVDGASPLTICLKIVLSYLKWPIMQKTLWSIIGSFTAYESIRLLTGGGPMGSTTTYAYYIYENAYKYQEYGYGAALSVVMVLMSCCFGLIMLRVFNVDKQIQDPRMDI